MVDAHGRRLEYLRLSLTERCNLGCVYCVPEHHEALPSDWMTDDEVVALVAALVPLGVRRVRLTGGEPTLRPRLPALVARLAALSLADLALTTNGTRLSELAAPLREAGLRRLNVSLDTLDAARFRRVTSGELDGVLAGIEAAHAAGFRGTKLNIVALAGENDDELPALARFAWARSMIPRFIELMPMSDGAVSPRGRLLPAIEIRARLTAAFGELIPEDGGAITGVGPARYLRTERGDTLGLIAAVTERFCATCNRVRVSARGRLHACLGVDDPEPVAGQADPLDLRAALRRGDVERVLRDALSGKAEGHGFSVSDHSLRGGPRRVMLVIGG